MQNTAKAYKDKGVVWISVASNNNKTGSKERNEQARKDWKIEHPIVRECLKAVPAPVGLEIVSIADLPAQTGMGSSSSFTVGLLGALHQATVTGQGQYVEVAMMDGVMNLCRVKFRDHQRLQRGSRKRAAFEQCRVWCRFWIHPTLLCATPSRAR